MKFLCVGCNEAMKLEQTTRPPDNGPGNESLTVVFACPTCGKRTAMLTNKMETQMVRSLGVKIGGRAQAAEPMEMTRSRLVHSGLADAGDTAEHGSSSAASTAPETGSKCPFTDVVSEALARRDGDIEWTQEAEERLARIPSFAQPMVKKGVEMHAIEKGYTEINDAVMDEVKDRFGM